uniref:Uncharacterized protein n=1 Tax=Oryza brachyantha TaxID=4533 RepID=J3LM15_ORYBR
MAHSQSASAAFFLATALLLLAFAGGQTTGAPPPPPPPNSSAAGGSVPRRRSLGPLGQLVGIGSGSLQQDCCPPIAQLQNNVAAKCVCAALNLLGLNLSLGSNGTSTLAGGILKICDRAPLNSVAVDCSQA